MPSATSPAVAHQTSTLREMWSKRRRSIAIRGARPDIQGCTVIMKRPPVSTIASNDQVQSSRSRFGPVGGLVSRASPKYR